MLLESWQALMAFTVILSVWMLVDWWRVERHQSFPDEHETQHHKQEDTQ